MSAETIKIGGAARIHLVLMSRAPLAGETKTRLTPPLTAEQAVAFHAACLNDLIEAARQLDETMSDIKDSGRLMSLERIELQAALNFSAQLLELRRTESRRQETFDTKIRSLADRIDAALDD